MKSGREVAELKPVPAGCRLSEWAALLKTSAKLTPDETESFEKDIEAARVEIAFTPSFGMILLSMILPFSSFVAFCHSLVDLDWVAALLRWDICG